MAKQFYIHKRYRFDGPVMITKDNIIKFFNATKVDFDDGSWSRDKDIAMEYSMGNIEPTTIELILRLMPDSWYKDQFRVYLKSSFYDEILEE